MQSQHTEASGCDSHAFSLGGAFDANWALRIFTKVAIYKVEIFTTPKPISVETLRRW